MTSHGWVWGFEVSALRRSNSQYLWIRRCSAVARDSTEVGELVLEVACGNGVEAAVPCGPKYE